MPPFDTGTDLRSWIAILEAADELKLVPAQVDWDEEIGAVTRANMALERIRYRIGLS
tara:strand:+ start:276 stop:446 length:171 start_codon:yes stop_codon:yes gene_type:complete